MNTGVEGGIIVEIDIGEELLHLSNSLIRSACNSFRMSVKERSIPRYFPVGDGNNNGGWAVVVVVVVVVVSILSLSLSLLFS